MHSSDDPSPARDNRRPPLPRLSAEAEEWPSKWPCGEGYVDLDRPVEEEFPQLLDLVLEGGDPC